MVAVLVNKTQTELIVDFFLVLLGKFTLGNFEAEALLREQFSLALDLFLGGLGSCKLSHVSLAKNLERDCLSGGNEGCESNEDGSHISVFDLIN
jgi:hypothetical protein